MDLIAAKSEFEKTADGLSTKLATIETYIGQDSQRQEVLQRYTREESARQATSVRELVAREYVGKSTYQEDVRAIERKFEGITNPQNGSIATQIATYKSTVDGRFTEITSLLSGKANQVDFQRVRETSQLYERILGNTNNSIADNVARMAMTSQLFQVEVGKYGSDGINRALNTSKGWTSFITIASPAGINLNADLHKVVASGLVAGDKLHVCLEISIDDVQPITGKTATAVLQSWGDVKKWNSGNPFGYRLGNLIAGNNWRKIEYDVTLTEQMLGNNFWWLNVRVDGASRYKVHTKLLKIEKGSRATPWSPAPEDTDEAIRTVQTQLAGSWAVKNLTNSGDVLNSINLLANGTNRIDGRLTHITGQTLIDNAVIKDGMIANVSANKLTAGTIDARTVNLINLNANNVTSGTFRGLTFEGGIVRGNNGNTVINLNDNVTTYNGYAKIEFKSPGNSLEFNSGGRKAFLAPTIAQGTSYAAFAFGVNDRGDCDPNRDFVGLKIFNQPGVRRIDIIGDLTLTRYEEHGIKSTSLQKLFELINDNFKRLREFRVQNGEGSPGFWDVSI